MLELTARQREAELAEDRQALLARLAGLDITAPVAGVVHELQVFGPQAVIRPAAPLLYLVPQNRPLAIQARIAPSKVIAVDEDIILPPTARADLPGGAALLPGMPVDAFIGTQAQRPITYLLAPFSSYFDRAFRE